MSKYSEFEIDIEHVVKEITPPLMDLKVTPSLEEQTYTTGENGYAYKNVVVEPIKTEEINVTPSENEEIREGIFNKVTVAPASLENLEVTPSMEEQTFKSNKYGYADVKVNPIESEELSITPSSSEQVQNGLFNKVTVAPVITEDLEVTPTKEIQNFKSETYGYANITVNAIQNENLEVTPSMEEQNFTSEKDGYLNVKVNAITSEEISIKPTIEEQIKEGLYNKVTVNAIQNENLEVTPSMEEQNFTSEKDGYLNVKVNAIQTEEITVTPTKEEQIKEGLYNKVTVNGDPDLLPENIKAGSNIFGVEGSYNGYDLTKIGTPVTVEAHNSFLKGDKFYGIKNENVELTLLTSGFTVGNNMSIATVSDDFSVAVLSQTIGPDTKKYYVGIFDEKNNEYDVIGIDMPEKGTILATHNYNGTINEDGSLIVVTGFKNIAGCYAGTLVVSIDKVNKTGKTVYYNTLGNDEFYYNGYLCKATFTNANSGSYGDPKNFRVAKNYFIGRANMDCTYTNSSGTTGSIGALDVNYMYKIENGEFVDPNKPIWFKTRALNAYEYYFEDIIDIAWADDNTLLYLANYKHSRSSNALPRLGKFTFDEDEVSFNMSGSIFSSNPKAGPYIKLSKNGRYFSTFYVSRIGDYSSDAWARIYTINISTLSYTMIIEKRFDSKTAVKIYPDSTGEYILINDKIYKYKSNDTNLTQIASGISIKSNHFEIINDKFMQDNSFKFLSNNSSDAEYIIYSPTNAPIENESRIYGIVPNDINIGEKTTAQKLFEVVKFSPKLQTKTIAPSDTEQIIAPDGGYDGLSSVKISAIPPIKLQTKTITPSDTEQIIAPDEGYDGLSSVTISAIPTT